MSNKQIEINITAKGTKEVLADINEIDRQLEKLRQPISIKLGKISGQNDILKTFDKINSSVSKVSQISFKNDAVKTLDKMNSSASNLSTTLSKAITSNYLDDIKSNMNVLSQLNTRAFSGINFNVNTNEAANALTQIKSSAEELGLKLSNIKLNIKYDGSTNIKGLLDNNIKLIENQLSNTKKVMSDIANLNVKGGSNFKIEVDSTKANSSINTLKSEAKDLGISLSNLKVNIDASTGLATIKGSIGNAIKNIDGQLENVKKTMKNISNLPVSSSSKFTIEADAKNAERVVETLKSDAKELGIILSNLKVNIDNKNGLASVKGSIQNNISEPLNEATIEFKKNLNNAISGQNWGRLSTALSKFTQSFGSDISSSLMNYIGKGFFSTFNFSFDKIITRYDTLNTYADIMQALGFSANDASQAVNKLEQSVLGLPTSLDSIVSLQKNFAMLTGDIKKSTEYAIGLNNLFVGSGLDDSQQYFVYAQMRDIFTGKTLTEREWLSLTSNLGEGLGIIADQMGLSLEQFKKQVSSETMDAETLGNLLIGLQDNKKLNKLLQIQKTTFSSLASNIGISFSRLGANILNAMDNSFKTSDGKSLVVYLKEILDETVNSLDYNAIADTLKNVVVSFKETLKGIDLNELLKVLLDFIKIKASIYKFIYSDPVNAKGFLIFKEIGGILEIVSKPFQLLINSKWLIKDLVATKFLGISTLFAKISSVFSKIGSMVFKTTAVKKAVSGINSTIKPLSLLSNNVKNIDFKGLLSKSALIASIGVLVVSLGSGVKLFASGLKDISSVSKTTINRGLVVLGSLTGVATAISALAVAVSAMGVALTPAVPIILATSGIMIAIGGSLKLISSAIEQFSLIDEKETELKIKNLDSLANLSDRIKTFVPIDGSNLIKFETSLNSVLNVVDRISKSIKSKSETNIFKMFFEKLFGTDANSLLKDNVELIKNSYEALNNIKDFTSVSEITLIELDKNLNSVMYTVGRIKNVINNTNSTEVILPIYTLFKKLIGTDENNLLNKNSELIKTTYETLQTITNFSNISSEEIKKGIESLTKEDGLLNVLSNNLKNIVNKISTIFDGIIVRTLNKQTSTKDGTTNTTTMSLSNTIEANIEDFKNFTDMLNNINSVITSLMSITTYNVEDLTSKLDVIKTNISTIFDKISNWFTTDGERESANPYAKSSITWLGNALGDTETGYIGVINKLMNLTSTIGAISGISEDKFKLLDTYQSFLNKIKSVFGIGTFGEDGTSTSEYEGYVNIKYNIDRLITILTNLAESCEYVGEYMANGITEQITVLQEKSQSASDQLIELKNAINNLPTTKKINIIPYISNLNTVSSQLDYITRNRTITIDQKLTPFEDTIGNPSNWNINGTSSAVKKASGGIIGYHPGSPSGTDTVPAWLTPGEYVVKRSAVKTLGRRFLDMVNRGDIYGISKYNFGNSYYNTGGYVSNISNTNNNNAQLTQNIFTNSSEYTYKRANNFIRSF